jgi:hypothetical protein
MIAESKAKERLALWLNRRFSVRVHFSLILAASFGVGLATTKGFLALGMATMHWRWPIALLAAYLAFLLCVRLWLSYVGLGRYLGDGRESTLDFPDLNVSGGSGSSGGGGVSLGDALPRVGGGGGQFGGGGASGDFALAAGDSDAGGGLSSSLKSVAGDAFGGSDEGCLVVLVILALLAVVFGVGVYMVWQAPALLAEAAFEAALAAGLIKPLRRVADPGWLGGTVRASWVPFLVIFACTMTIAGLAEHYAPDATTLVEAIYLILQ